MVAAIVWLSLTPSPPALDFTASDKLGHLAAYGLLMFWFSLLYVRNRTRALYGIAFLALGVGLEIIQGMTGYRSYDLADMAANSAGVVLGWLFGRTLS
jgi:VanZ family protein